MTESCLGFASEENVIISLFFAKRCIEKLSLVAELFANVLLKLGKWGQQQATHGEVDRFGGEMCPNDQPPQTAGDQVCTRACKIERLGGHPLHIFDRETRVLCASCLIGSQTTWLFTSCVLGRPGEYTARARLVISLYASILKNIIVLASSEQLLNLITNYYFFSFTTCNGMTPVGF